MVTFGDRILPRKLNRKNVLKLVRNLHKFKINRKNRHKRSLVPVCG